MQQNQNFENMPIKMWLPSKRQIAWIKICHTKLLTEKFQEKLLFLWGLLQYEKNYLRF